MAIAETTQPDSLSDQRRRAPRRWAGPLAVSLLLLAGLLVGYRVIVPLRSENALRRASLQELEAASRREPNNPRVFYYLGLRAQQAGQDRQAMDAFWHAANLAPDDQKLWLIWSQTAYAVQGRQAALSILM